MTKRSQNQILMEFHERFLKIAEKQTGLDRDERGFLLSIKESLDLPQLSTAQRWVEGSSMARIKNLIVIYERWGVTPNELLGINGSQKRRKRV